MNEITFTGNVSKIYDRRITASGVTIFSFDLAVDNGYFDRNRNRWISRTRFQPVITYRALAENTANTLTKGMAATVTGKLLDDSFTPDGSDYVVRRDKLEALDVAVSLRFATAVVTKAGKSTVSLRSLAGAASAAMTAHATLTVGATAERSPKPSSHRE